MQIWTIRVHIITEPLHAIIKRNLFIIASSTLRLAKTGGNPFHKCYLHRTLICHADADKLQVLEIRNVNTMRWICKRLQAKKFPSERFSGTYFSYCVENCAHETFSIEEKGMQKILHKRLTLWTRRERK